MSNKPPAGSFTLLYFAAAATYTGKATEPLPASLPISKLFDTLESQYPGIKQKVLASCAVTVNLDYVDVEEDGRASDLVIRDGDEVAIIPPVSSG
ncbi:molybdopterin synthase sulfur carrier subunit [Lasallia pustulata]|uniref:Molybdopterin synthase sulfur carrier subunit n=1 Tax=Lasallia pustulata TaxID=136370 RepID=A0A1W5CTC5_9LECA|nr:molybdopterin synthase sulfur carrier subunit [Lasallia pustulata]